MKRWCTFIQKNLNSDILYISLSPYIKLATMVPYHAHNWVVEFQPITGAIEELVYVP